MSQYDDELIDNKEESSLEVTDEGRLGPAPTEEELATLPKVSDRLPFSVWLVAAVELCERFCYNGLAGPFQNYMQLDRQHPGDSTYKHGGLGMGQQEATALSYFFQFWCYVTPILGAIIADSYCGKYKTIVMFAIVYCVGNLVLFITSLPFSLNNNGGTGGLIAAMVVIGLGTGGIKPNVSPLIADQYTNTKPYVKTLKDGNKVIVDPTITIQSIFLIFYFCINFGSLSSIATTELEQRVDFWAAYLLPFAFFFVGVFCLFAGRKAYVKRPPMGSVIPDSFRILFVVVRNGFSFDAAKPSVRSERGLSEVGWTDLFVDEVKRSLYACQVFVVYPVYWLVYGQMINNFISQAGTMATHGMPNDIMQVFDSIAIIVFIPIFNKVIYPLLRRIGIQMKPITRIFWGFMFAAMSMVYAAVLQHYIYKEGECSMVNGEYTCLKHNNVHIAIQTPAYVLIGISEILASVTGIEYAYTKAPANMKSFIMALYLLTTAIGSALGIALSSVSIDPKVLWLYTGLACATFICGCIIWILFRHLNEMEEALNEIDADYTAELNANIKEQQKYGDQDKTSQA
ncbi:peptide transporter Ptr2p [Trichomonascus vanleenenianus]|uniref:peptide transporter Ptr2p n=1 Tax=Trichomonascus vanleenenianus TaxID=2268995 RepID=UPI003EC9FA9E